MFNKYILNFATDKNVQLLYNHIDNKKDVMIMKRVYFFCRREEEEIQAGVK